MTIQFDVELTRCVACDSPDISRWAVKSNQYGQFAISRCAACGTGFLNPRPSLDWLLANIYIHSGHGLRKPPDYEAILQAEADYPNATVDARTLLAGAASILPPWQAGVAPRVLDVGSGYGFYSLEAARRGFAVTAINPAAWENALYRRLLDGYESVLIEESFEAHSFGDKRFDLIIASQVLEHVHMPRAFLQKLEGLLAKDGVLVVAVPNFQWLLVRLLRTRESGVLWLPEHLNYFTYIGLAHLLRSIGLTIRKRSNVSRIPYTALSRRLHLSGHTAHVTNMLVRTAQWLPMRLTEVADASLAIQVWAQRANKSAE